MNNDQTLSSIRFYARFAPQNNFIHPAESSLFSMVLQQGMRVLDLGCGTGRVTRELLRRKMEVHACDLDAEALQQVQCGPDVRVEVADARNLPYSSGYFDAVVFAYNGIDYMNPESDRSKAILEIDRILKPGGWFIFSSHNPLGGLLSPRGLRSIRSLKWRIASLIRRDFLKTYARDPNGMILWQGTPHRIADHIENISHLKFYKCLDRTARVGNRLALTLFAPWPHYLFKKQDK